MPEMEFHDRELFPGLQALELATEAIRGEFNALLAAEAAEMVPYVQYPERVPLRQWKELNNNPKWTAIHLLQYGWRVEVKCATLSGNDGCNLEDGPAAGSGRIARSDVFVARAAHAHSGP